MALSVPAAGQIPRDTIRLENNFQQARYELEFGENFSRLDRFIAAVDSVYGASVEPYQIIIHSSASPEGDVQSNHMLSLNRGRSLRFYLMRHLANPPERILVVPHGEEWSGLEEILQRLDTPWRDDVLSIIRHTPDTLERKRLIRSIDDGKVWNWLLKYQFPLLRRAVIAIGIPMNTEIIPPIEALTPSAQPDSCIGLFSSPADSLADKTQKEKKGIAFALKTNFISDALLSPNVELEIPFGNRWSLALDWTFPWWLFKNNSYCEELLGGTVQMRRYFGDREKKGYFTGWYAGLNAGVGYYDFQIPPKGAQGEYALAGISGGYSLRLGEYFNLEFELGVGGILTQYRRYTPLENYSILLYQDTIWTYWLGPNRAKVSLVWRLGKKCRSSQKGNNHTGSEDKK